MRNYAKLVLSVALLSAVTTAAQGIIIDGGPGSIIRTSDVSTVVTGAGPYVYNYTVKNTSPAPQTVIEGERQTIVYPLIVDYEVPLDDPGVVSNVLSPEGWRYEFISASQYDNFFGVPNPFDSAWVLHWYTGNFSTQQPTNHGADDVWFKPIAPENYPQQSFPFYPLQTDGFIFTSLYGPENGPYSTSWQDDFRNIGDPPLPGGGVGGGGTLPFQTQSGIIPEPLSALLAGLALAALALRRRG